MRTHLKCLDQDPAHSDKSVVLGMGLNASLKSLVSGVVPLKEVEVEISYFGQAEG